MFCNSLPLRNPSVELVHVSSDLACSKNRLIRLSFMNQSDVMLSAKEQRHLKYRGMWYNDVDKESPAQVRQMLVLGILNDNDQKCEEIKEMTKQKEDAFRQSSAYLINDQYESELELDNTYDDDEMSDLDAEEFSAPPKFSSAGQSNFRAQHFNFSGTDECC